MKARAGIAGFGMTLSLGIIAVLLAAGLAAQAQAPATPPPPAAAPPAAASDVGPGRGPPMPPLPYASADALAAGSFVARKLGGTKYHLVVAGHKLTSRSDIEMFMAYRAAQLTLSQGYFWFELIEHRAKGDKVAASKPDPAGPRFSFRMAYWRPMWRYKLAGAKDWKSWSPFSGNPFAVSDGKTVSDYEVSADIVLHKGMLDDSDPRDFDAPALSDFLVNQALPAK